MQIWVCALYLIIIGCVTTSLIIMLLKGRAGIHNLLYASCQLSVIIWCASQIMLGISQTIKDQWTSYILGNLGICLMGTLWLLFVKSYNHKEGRLAKGWFFLGIFPLLFYGLFLTNGYHHLYYKIFEYRNVVRGPVFYGNVIYSYACVLIGGLLLLRRTSLSDAVNVYTAKAMIIAAAFVPIILNMLQLLGISKADYDITAIGFGISTILVLCATIRFNFMDVNIKVFDSVIHNLTDGVMLFEGGENVYHNPAFWHILNEKEKQITLSDWEKYKNENLTAVKQEGTQEVYKTLGDETCYIAVEQISHDVKHEILVLRDVSEYYALLEANNELAISRQQYVLSEERNRIAQQVHDTTGHTLVMVQSLLKLSLMEKEKAEDYLGQAQGLVKTGLKELRESINRMRQEEESYLVTQAIKQLTGQVHEFAIEVTMQGEDSERYAYLTKTIYDTLRETITNCLKYANATKMEIVVRFFEDKLELFIADNGEGCDNIMDNNGLRGIKERIEAREGSVRFISSKGEGFMTKVSLPVRQ